LDEFIEILQVYHINVLVDVRSVPKSRHTPQFNETILQKVLPQHGIAYKHLEKLGGLRHTTKDSINQGWHNTSFRGYADYMQTEEFLADLEELLQLAEKNIVAIMCAEAVLWRCHRSLIGDAMLVRGHHVVDIFNGHIWKTERMTSFAKVEKTKITYPKDT
jgi:uncharacterized protein (DUF488 family)